MQQNSPFSFELTLFIVRRGTTDNISVDLHVVKSLLTCLSHKNNGKLAGRRIYFFQLSTKILVVPKYCLFCLVAQVSQNCYPVHLGLAPNLLHFYYFVQLHRFFRILPCSSWSCTKPSSLLQMSVLEMEPSSILTPLP